MGRIVYLDGYVPYPVDDPEFIVETGTVFFAYYREELYQTYKVVHAEMQHYVYGMQFSATASQLCAIDDNAYRVIEDSMLNREAANLLLEKLSDMRDQLNILFMGK